MSTARIAATLNVAHKYMLLLLSKCDAHQGLGLRLLLSTLFTGLPHLLLLCGWLAAVCTCLRARLFALLAILTALGRLRVLLAVIFAQQRLQGMLPGLPVLRYAASKSAKVHVETLARQSRAKVDAHGVATLQ